MDKQLIFKRFSVWLQTLYRKQVTKEKGVFRNTPFST